MTFDPAVLSAHYAEDSLLAWCGQFPSCLAVLFLLPALAGQPVIKDSAVNDP
jgi:hypothetical protein